jgi:hypothetical protein
MAKIWEQGKGEKVLAVETTRWTSAAFEKN